MFDDEAVCKAFNFKMLQRPSWMGTSVRDPHAAIGRIQCKSVQGHQSEARVVVMQVFLAGCCSIPPRDPEEGDGQRCFDEEEGMLQDETVAKVR